MKTLALFAGIWGITAFADDRDFSYLKGLVG
jgi:hypothetical protein